MRTTIATIKGFLGGAATAYYFDPDMGRRRRAQARDKIVETLHDLAELIEKASRDATNRVRGVAARAVSFVRREQPDDHRLHERIRSALGRCVSHPSSIEVEVHDDRIILSGPILAGEVSDLLGGGLLLWAVRRGGMLGGLAGCLGAALLARGLSNFEMKRLVGVGAGRRAIDFHKTITVDAPVDRVFEFWSHYENFPRFMLHVREVRDLGDGRSHWVVAGPAGAPVHWNSVITRQEPNRVLAWSSEPGSMVQHAGIVRFDELPDGKTRLDIRMSYNPGAGALGHVVATLLGANPKRALDEDLVRFKSLMETGKTRADAGRVTAEQVSAESR